MRAMIGELRLMSFSAMRFTTAGDSDMLAFGAKSLTDDSLQPARASDAATVDDRKATLASLASIGRPVVFRPTQPAHRNSAGSIKGGTVGPLTLKIDYRKR